MTQVVFPRDDLNTNCKLLQIATVALKLSYKAW